MFDVVIKTVRRPGPALDFSAAPAIIGAVSGASEAVPELRGSRGAGGASYGWSEAGQSR